MKNIMFYLFIVSHVNFIVSRTIFQDFFSSPIGHCSNIRTGNNETRCSSEQQVENVCGMQRNVVTEIRFGALIRTIPSDYEDLK